ERGRWRVRAGVRITDKGIARQGEVIYSDAVAIGGVASGTLSPPLGVGIGMGYAPPGVSKPSQSFEIKIRDRRVSAGVVKMPFYQRRSDSTVVVMGEEMGVRDFRTRYGHPQTLVAQN